MECSIGRLEGCDQETLDSVTEEPGTTLQDLREKQYRTCGPCSMAVLEDCQQTGQDRDTICRYLLYLPLAQGISVANGRRRTIRASLCREFATDIVRKQSLLNYDVLG